MKKILLILIFLICIVKTYACDSVYKNNFKLNQLKEMELNIKVYGMNAKDAQLEAQYNIALMECVCNNTYLKKMSGEEFLKIVKTNKVVKIHKDCSIKVFYEVANEELRRQGIRR